MVNRSQDLFDALRDLLTRRKAHTQEAICIALEKQGFEINQSKVSRSLRKIGAIKVLDAQGQIVYSLPREPGPPSLQIPLRQLIFDVSANESLVVICTSPGSASMIARILDYYLEATEILGTIAGDDTLFVAPKSTKDTQKLTEKIKNLLMK